MHTEVGDSGRVRAYSRTVVLGNKRGLEGLF